MGEKDSTELEETIVEARGEPGMSTMMALPWLMSPESGTSGAIEFPETRLTVGCGAGGIMVLQPIMAKAGGATFSTT